MRVWDLGFKVLGYLDKVKACFRSVGKLHEVPKHEPSILYVCVGLG